MFTLRKQQSVHIGNLANIVTLSGILLCVLAGIMAAHQYPLWMVVLSFLLGSLCDIVDGALARRVGQDVAQSSWGGFLDTFADKIGEVSLLLGLAFRYSNAETIRVLMCSACSGLLCSFIKSAASEKGLHLNWPEVRILGRTMRVCILTIGLLVVTHPEHFTVRRLGIVLTAWNIVIIVVRAIRIYRHHQRMMRSSHF